MLYCILCVWNEEDIIASTVRHAYAQGCDKVFIIDNDSTDKTVQQAVRAGAIYHARFASEHFDEAQKTVYINKCALGLNEQSPDDKNWWLYLDADEFPDFHNGKSIKRNLSELPGDVRAVGGHVCNHLPTHEPYCIPGYHPADFMPVGVVDRSSIWKFNLLRHDNDQPPIYARSGAHTYNTNGGAMREADIRYIIHHFNYRKLDAVSKRLRILLARDEYGKSRIDWMDEMTRIAGGQKSGYHTRLETLHEVYETNRYQNLKINTLDYDYTMMCRWYDPTGLGDSLSGHCDGLGLHIWRGTMLFHLGRYEKALFAFHDALELASAEPLHGLLLLAIARCCKRMEDPTFETVFQILAVHPYEEIRTLARGLE